MQEQERLLKLQKVNEPGVPLADFAAEIVEIESLNTSEAEQVQEETVDLQPDEQVSHDCSTQAEAFDNLYQFRDDNAKVSFYTGLPTYEVLEATFIHVSPFVKRRTQCLSLFQEMTMVL